MIKHLSITLPLSLAMGLAINGCDTGSNSGGGNKSFEQAAIVATPASDYQSGTHAVIDTLAPYSASTELAPTISDITVAAYGSHFYRIERFRGDNISKFSLDDPSTPIWNYSTLDADDDISGNPQDIIFASESRAFVLRYGKATAWEVNPTAGTPAEFKLGEIDLSAYDDGDGSPEMTTGVIVDNKLFIAMQRQVMWIPTDAYVAVFDLDDLSEIDTLHAGDELAGIPLGIKNPGKIEYNPGTGLIYVQGIGNYDSDTFDGGIATIDPDSYTTEVLIDDDSTDNGGIGKISGFTIVDQDKGYLVNYAGWGDNTLYSFNPQTGDIDSTAVDGSLSHIFIDDIAVDNQGILWVSNQTLLAMTLIDSADDSIVESAISTQMSPTRIVFARK